MNRYIKIGFVFTFFIGQFVLFYSNVLANSFFDYIKNNKGINEYNRKDNAKALQSFTEVLENDKNSPEIFYNLGNVLYKEKDFKAAKGLYQDSLNRLKDKQKKGSVYYNLGNANYNLGDMSAAIENYKKAVEINPEDMSAKYNLELAYSVKREKKRGDSGDENIASDIEEEKDKNKVQAEQGLGGLDQKDREVRMRYINKKQKSKIKVDRDW
jgi:tetratricopeptide (TPR) repeat protein